MLQTILQRIQKLIVEKDDLGPLFRREVDIAKTMVKLIRIQDKYVREIENAIMQENVSELNRLLVKCERLDLATHPSVSKARAKLSLLHKKRSAMMIMVDFLRHDNESCEIIPETLAQAEELGVDPDFIAKVQRIYESASPRLVSSNKAIYLALVCITYLLQRARNKLRRAIETVDKSGIVDGIAEISGLQLHYPDFASMEIRAGRCLLSMLSFESHLYPMLQSGPARLSDDVLSLCHEICLTPEGDAQRALRKKLLKLAGTHENYELLIRSYKWSKIYCTWKYPEIVSKSPASSTQSSSVPDECGDFFGLITEDARASKYLIRSLHQDIDCVLGDAPASIQAALGVYCYCFISGNNSLLVCHRCS